jgi:hypothetical protein
MDNKLNVIKCFNEKMNEFVSDLLKLYPNDTDFQTLKTSLSMLHLVDDRKLMRLFRKYVHDDYKTKLLNKNDDFFLNHDYNEEVGEFGDDKVDLSNGLIKKLKDYWVNISEENKEIIWKYFKVLILLCDKYDNL